MKQKRQLYKIIAAAVLFAVAFMLPVSGYWRLAVWSAAYLIVGLPIVRKAFRNIGHGQVFDENFLMTAATAGAFALGEYSEGVAVMLFYQIGELFQSYAVNKSRKSIAALMDIRPDYANIERDGKVVRVSPEDVRPGEDIIVTAGEKIPLDGRNLTDVLNAAARTEDGSKISEGRHGGDYRRIGASGSGRRRRGYQRLH